MAEEKVKVIAKTRLYLADEDRYVEVGQECFIKRTSFDVLGPRGDVEVATSSQTSKSAAKPAIGE